MAQFEINLMRDRQLSPCARLCLFWGMVGYVALCGLVLVGVAGHGTRKLVGVMDHRRELARLEKQFRTELTGGTDVWVYARGLKADTQKYAATLENISAALSERHLLARVLSGLCLPLPAGCYVVSFELERAKNQMLFDVVAPVDAQGRSVNTAKLMAAWNGDPALKAELGTVKLDVSERQNVDGRPALILKFSCTLGKKEA